jgi:hypothetical protein
MIFVDTVDEVLNYALRERVEQHPPSETARSERTVLN